MEHNLGKLKADAEARILQEMKEEEALRKEVHMKKCQYLSIITEEQIKKCLDLQVRAPSFLVILIKEVKVKHICLWENSYFHLLASLTLLIMTYYLAKAVKNVYVKIAK